MNFDIPSGLTDLLQEFTVAVLRERPPDLILFATQYFSNLLDNRDDIPEHSKILEKRGVSFGPVGSDGEDDIRTESDMSDDEPMPEPPMNRFQRRKSVSAERYDPEAEDDDSETKAIYPKSDEQRRRLIDVVRGILLFRTLDEEQMQDVIDAMFERKVEPNDHVIDQGDDGDNFYVIDSGTYDIFVDKDGQPLNVGKYDNAGSFGELALMYSQPRAATIVATSPGSLWAMDRTTFRRIILKNAFQKRKLYETLLENVPMLNTLDTYERMNVADALVPRLFGDGELIIQQGDEADCMFFVESGEARIVMVNNGDAEKKEVELTRCTKGQYFGELALLTAKPRAASVYAVGQVKLAVLDINAFERLLGPCKELMARNVSEYEDQLAKLFGSTTISDLR